jgi:Galactose oxidase, central domain
VVSRWYEGSGRLPPRTAHSAAYLPELDALFIYGGYNLNTVLNDLHMFSFSENRWSILTARDTEQVSVPVANRSAQGLMQEIHSAVNQSQLLNNTNKGTDGNTAESELRGSAYLRYLLNF